MHRFRLARILLVAILSVAGVSTSKVALAADAEYTVTDIGSLAGTADGQFDILTKISPCEINNSGVVVSNSVPTDQTFWAAPFTSTDGKIRRLGKEREFTYVTDMNESGDVVGYSTSLDDTNYLSTVPIVWRDREPTELPRLSEGGALAGAINNAGVIVGDAQAEGEGEGKHAVMWTDGIIQDLGTLGGATSHASAINNEGIVVGSSLALDRKGSFAFIWQEGEMRELILPDGMNGGASALNDAGEIVGLMYDSTFALHALRWEDGEPVALPSLFEGGTSVPFDINAKGQVVGWGAAAITESTDYSAVLWDGDNIVDLNDLIPPDSGYELESGQAINDLGQIVATGIAPDGFQHGVLLTPIGEETAGVVAWPVVAAVIKPIQSLNRWYSA